MRTLRTAGKIGHCGCRASRGMAFATTMIVLLGIMTIILVGASSINGTVSGPGTGTASINSNALWASQARVQNSTAFTLADSGIEYTLQWLNSQSTPPSQTSAFAPTLWGATLTGTPQRAVVNYPILNDPSHNFSVLIYPDSGNASASQKKYMIESVGTSGLTVQVVRAYTQVVSFGKYAYFSDHSSATSFWENGTTSFNGPVHVNNLGGTLNSFVWKPSSSTPIFNYSGSDAFTAAGAGANWYVNSPTVSGNPSSTSDWNSIALGGQSTVHFGAPTIQFPTSSMAQMNAALAGTAAPSSLGATVPSASGATTGGIYIHGDIQQMTLTDVSGNQVITINQTTSFGLPLVTVITLNAALNTTIVATTAILGGLPNTLISTYAGLTNGVIYTDGNIGTQTAPKTGGLSGIVADNQTNAFGQITIPLRLTVATEADKNINIDGSITYNTHPLVDVTGALLPPAQNLVFDEQAGTFGLISNTVEVVDKNGSGLPITAIEVDATVLAFNTYDATDTGTRPVGTFKSVGSFLVENGGAFGLLSSSGQLTSGLSTTRIFDDRLANNPPPVFPTTNNQYDILSWQCVSGTLS